MRSIVERKALLAVLVIGWAGSVSLQGCEEDPVGSPRLIEVTMMSDAANVLPIHILGPQEGFDPSNRIDPGGSRQTVVRTGFGGPRAVEFRAGRNGQVIMTEVCEDVNPTGGGAIVEWFDDGPPRLDCSGSLENLGPG